MWVLTVIPALSFQTLELAFDSLPEVLPGTRPLPTNMSQEQIADKMMAGAHLFIERKIKEAQTQRKLYWQRNPSSRKAYERSIDPNVVRFKQAIGLEDSTNRYPNFHVGFCG